MIKEVISRNKSSSSSSATGKVNGVSCSTITTTGGISSLSQQSVSGSLELSVGFSARAVLASLQAHPPLANCVTEVVVKHAASAITSSSIGSSSAKEITHLLALVGKICPRLEALKILLDGSHSGAEELPVTALTAFFQQAPRHLVSLKISAVIAAQCGHRDFMELEEAIHRNAPASWNELRLEFCEPSRDTPSLDPLVGAFARAGSLQQVTLSGTSITHTRCCTGPSLVKLVSSSGSSNLKMLTIFGGKRRLDTQDTCALIRALETNATLKELTLHARGINPTVGRALARCLSVNTSLERLVLCVSDSYHLAPAAAFPRRNAATGDYVITTTLLADALRQENRTLRMLSLDYSTENEVAMGDSLDHDFFEFEVMDQTIKATLDAQAVKKAFTKMLHSNPVLEVLWMNIDHQDDAEEEHAEEEGLEDGSLLTSEMDMLLRLNRYGIRQRLFQREPSPSSMEWMTALASQRDDLNALFYLISRNPSLCCLAEEPRGSKRRAPTHGDDGHGPSKKQKTAY